MAIVDWDKRYQQGDSPWVHKQPLKHLMTTVEKYIPKASSVLEIGCGFGIESIALAKAGYSVTGMDVSETAIKQAKVNAEQLEDSTIFFEAYDAINQPICKTYHAVLDIAVLMPLATRSQLQEQVINKISSLLQSGDYWFNMSCIQSEVKIKEQETGTQGPPAFPLKSFQSWVNKNFEIIEVVDTVYEVNRTGQPVLFPAKIFVLKKR